MITPGVSNIKTVWGQEGFTSWTPSYTAGSGTLTTVTTNEAASLIRGVDTEFYADITITTHGTAAGAFIFTLPSTPAQTEVFVGIVTTGVPLQAIAFSGSNLCYVLNKTNTTIIASGVRFSLRGRYRNT